MTISPNQKRRHILYNIWCVEKFFFRLLCDSDKVDFSRGIKFKKLQWIDNSVNDEKILNENAPKRDRKRKEIIIVPN